MTSTPADRSGRRLLGYAVEQYGRCDMKRALVVVAAPSRSPWPRRPGRSASSRRRGARRRSARSRRSATETTARPTPGRGDRHVRPADQQERRRRLLQGQVGATGLFFGSRTSAGTTRATLTAGWPSASGDQGRSRGTPAEGWALGDRVRKLKRPLPHASAPAAGSRLVAAQKLPFGARPTDYAVRWGARRRGKPVA